ncbi:hypothetical protein J27TS7_51760 [Paenibacillus dendritiformis]|nr:hypothetical protein J27TS7_51760 [Paenibacillus dendritiformis]
MSLKEMMTRTAAMHRLHEKGITDWHEAAVARSGRKKERGACPESSAGLPDFKENSCKRTEDQEESQ